MGSRMVKFSFQPEENEQIECCVQMPHEPRSVIHGIVKNFKGQVVKDAVVKLFEATQEPYILKPITHAFTDECGQFIFGPLDPEKTYVIKVWVNDIKIRHLIIEPDKECLCEQGSKDQVPENFEKEE